MLLAVGRVSSQTSETDNELCVKHSDCRAKICFKGTLSSPLHRLDLLAIFRRMPYHFKLIQPIENEIKLIPIPLGGNANKQCLSVSSGSLGLSSIDTVEQWEVRQVSSDRFEVSVTDGTDKLCLIQAGSGEGRTLSLHSCEAPTLWRFGLVSLPTFENNVWQMVSDGEEGLCVSAEKSDGSAPTVDADFDGDLRLKLDQCLEHGM